jgi:hypothetical protein
MCFHFLVYHDAATQAWYRHKRRRRLSRNLVLVRLKQRRLLQMLLLRRVLLQMLRMWMLRIRMLRMRLRSRVLPRRCMRLLLRGLVRAQRRRGRR